MGLWLVRALLDPILLLEDNGSNVQLRGLLKLLAMLLFPLHAQSVLAG